MRIAVYFDDSPISHNALNMAAAFVEQTDADLRLLRGRGHTTY